MEAGSCHRGQEGRLEALAMAQGSRWRPRTTQTAWLRSTQHRLGVSATSVSYALSLQVFLPHSRVRIQHRWHSRHESLKESSVMVLTRFRDTETRCSRCAVLGSLPNTGIPRRVWPCGGLSNRSPLLRLQLRQRRLQSLELLETPENLTSRIRTGWACMARP